jgi:hypothetical protein
VQVTNLKLTSEELKILENTDFFSAKLIVTRKIMDQFGALESSFRESLPHGNELTSEGVNLSNGKIFRGENYKGLPYVVLDYPRLFSTQSVFAFRTMFWWGHEFSFTLHLQGIAWEKRKHLLVKNLSRLLNWELYIGVNETPWQYQFNRENFVPIDEYLANNRREDLERLPFLKLSSRLEIRKFEILAQEAGNTFKMLMDIFACQEPI